MNTAARYQVQAAVVLAAFGVIAMLAALIYPALALSLAATLILIVRRRLHQPKTGWSRLAAILAGIVLVLTLYFLLTFPGGTGVHGVI